MKKFLDFSFSRNIVSNCRFNHFWQIIAIICTQINFLIICYKIWVWENSSSLFSYDWKTVAFQFAFGWTFSYLGHKTIIKSFKYTINFCMVVFFQQRNQLWIIRINGFLIFTLIFALIDYSNFLFALFYCIFAGGARKRDHQILRAQIVYCLKHTLMLWLKQKPKDCSKSWLLRVEQLKKCN